tara:strand:+ start:609 stop:1091 length:483 start_codon:yes stop_codon:yes gene_type:complete
MKFIEYKKIFLLILSFSIFLCSNTYSSEYQDVIKKVFGNRKIDVIEGIWEKTFANQGPTGCVTMFYKDQDEYYQVHIDECFVMGKVTGKQKKLSVTEYKGENAIYFYDRKVIWEPSSIKIEKNLNNLNITHGSYNNTFIEKWKRIWPTDINTYNKLIGDN